MAALSDRIENVLNEARMLLLGGQVLLACAPKGQTTAARPAA